MVKRGHRVNGPQASEGEAQHGYFAGLDVSVKETSVCIVDDTGKIVREVKVASEPEAFLAVQKNPAYRFKRRALNSHCDSGPASNPIRHGMFVVATDQFGHELARSPAPRHGPQRVPTRTSLTRCLSSSRHI
jgi:hypothetical protein